MFEVEIFPLVPNPRLPRAASARTRAQVPAGYGVQEQCLPFVAASALGFLIPSPISFGLCLPEQMPPGARPFRSPVEAALPDGTYRDRRMFYVKDDPDCGFVGNAHVVDGMPGESGGAWYEPGISFFERHDQVDLFKVHLPYVWRTPKNIETFFTSPINRDQAGLTLLCGVVETDWYANPVNLVFRKRPGEHPLHVAPGDLIAQAIFLPRATHRPALEIVGTSTRTAGSFIGALGQWREQKAQDRSAYKRLSRRREGGPRGEEDDALPQQAL